MKQTNKGRAKNVPVQSLNTSQAEAQSIEVRYASSHASKSLIGIHLLAPDQSAFNDAVETALKDNYPQIILHTSRTWSTRATRATKDHKRAAALGWLTKLRETPHGRMSLEKLTHAGLVPETLIESLTEAQLKLLLSYVSSAYAAGCDMTREHFASMRRQESQSVQLKVLS